MGAEKTLSDLAVECKIKGRLEVGGGGFKDLPGRVATVQPSTALPLQGAPTEAQRQTPMANPTLNKCTSFPFAAAGWWEEVKGAGQTAGKT